MALQMPRMGLAWTLQPITRPSAAFYSLNQEHKAEEQLSKAQRSHSRPVVSSFLGQKFPPITGVAVVCRFFPNLNASEVVDLISEFADGSVNWIVSSVRDDLLSVWLLRRLHAREQRDPLLCDPFFRDWHFNQAANKAAARGNFPVLWWLVTEYSPWNVMTEAVKHAASNDQVEIAKWMYEDYPYAILGFGELYSPRETHVDVFKYLATHPPPSFNPKEQLTPLQWESYVLDTALEDCFYEVANLPYVQWAIMRGSTGDGRGLRFAARAGHLDVTQWLAGYLDRLYWSGGGIREDEDDDGSDRDFIFPQTICLDELIGPEAFAVAKWLHEQHFSWLKLSGTDVAMAMNVSCSDYVKWLYEHKYGKCTSRVIDCAAIRGDFDLVKWLSTHSSVPCTVNGIDGAALHGNLEMIKWLHDNLGAKCTDAAFKRAMRKGHVDVAKWLLQNMDTLQPKLAISWVFRYQINQDPATAEGMESNMEMIKWLYENFHDDFPSKLDTANIASRGQLLVLQFLLENDIASCSSSTMDAAAANNRMEVVKWLHANRTEGCTTNAMDSAAGNGHLEMVRWLHENRTEGCTTRAMKNAIIYGHLEVFRWLYEHRVEGASPRQIDDAARQGNFQIVRWLAKNCRHELFAQCSAVAMDCAATKGDLETVRILHEYCNGGCTVNAMDGAAINGHFQVLLFLHANRSEGCSAKALKRAFMYGHLEILRWLVFHYPHLYNPDDLLDNEFNCDSQLVISWVKHSGLPVRLTLDNVNHHFAGGGRAKPYRKRL